MPQNMCGPCRSACSILPYAAPDEMVELGQKYDPTPDSWAFSASDSTDQPRTAIGHVPPLNPHRWLYRALHPHRCHCGNATLAPWLDPRSLNLNPWNCHQGMSVSAITARLLAFGPSVVGPLHGAGVFTY
jgi:hypothetical protein